MIDIIGKYNTAHVYTDNIEEEAYKQILNMMNQKFCEGSNIAIMPDTHAGAGCTIGTTMTITDKVVPNLVSVDIGCGMLVLKVSKEAGDKIFNKSGLEKLDKVIKQYIPSGRNHRNTSHSFANNVDLSELIMLKEKTL